MRRLRVWALRIFVVVLALGLLLGVAGVLILPSQWFRDKVRNRLVFEIERASGGRAEIGDFRFDWKTLTVEVAPFILHGTEPPAERPLARAESVKVGLRIISMMKRDVDIAFLNVAAPQINILVDARGNTNFPPRKAKQSEQDPVEQLIRLAIGNIDIRDGWIRYNDREIPLALQGEQFVASLDHNADGPSYRGGLSMSKLRIETDKTGPLTLSFETKLGLFNDRIEIETAHAGLPNSGVDLSGSIVNFRDPVLRFNAKADAAVADVGTPLKLPKPHSGRVRFQGTLVYDSRERLLIAGRAHGSRLAVHQGKVRIENIEIDSGVRVTQAKAEFRGTRVQALGGRFTGMADLIDWKAYKVNGRVDGISLTTISRIAGVKTIPYSAAAAGPVEMTGTTGARDAKVAGQFTLTPVEAGVPVRGSVQIAYDQRHNTAQLGNSFVELPATRLDVSGTLGDSLSVRLDSKDLNDLTPALEAAGGKSVTLPLNLRKDGSALFEGRVDGTLESARMNGTLTLTNFETQQQKIDRLVAKVDATASGVEVSSFALGQETLRLEGNAAVDLHDWKIEDAAVVKAGVKLQGAQIERLLASAGQKNIPVSGQLSGVATISGTAGDPQAVMQINIDRPKVYGEQFDRARAEVRYAGTGVEVIEGRAESGQARVLLSGSYRHPSADWKNGRLLFDLSTQGFSLDRIARVREMKQDVVGAFELRARGSAAVRSGSLQPDQLDGVLALRNLAFEKRPVGNFIVDAKTSGSNLAVAINGNLRGSKISGNGSFQLDGDYPGAGSVEVAPIQISTLQDLLSTVKTGEPLPVEGTLAGRLTFSGPAAKPDAMRAKMELPTLAISPARRALNTQQTQDFSVKNDGPVILEYDNSILTVHSAHLVGRDTDMKASGAVNFKEKSPWDLRIAGNLNLGVLRDFNPDIISSGIAVVNATARGSLQDPQIVGRMELQKASFYVADVPNGLDNANGTILFDRRRATIEKLTAETGGGTIALGGFVGFGAPEIIYRLQARADDVRVRYPEGVSTTVSTNLNLSGTSSKSLLSGTVTVQRVSLNPRTDMGGIIAASAKPVAGPATPNPFLRGMQLDVHIESAPDLQLQTSLASDIQAESSLRVRGIAAKPSLLGRILVNQGQVEFFGNKYTINRGEIGFFNPTKIEPTLDVDLETTARGVQVTINFTGPLSKLNVSYRSDPPLLPNEIVALLAVGREPGTNSSLASSQTVASQTFMTSGANTLLGAAVSAPLNGRLQRFFGVSKLKIDPQLTGINAVPQARLTVEQQVSRDVTLTYITNLAQANQQIVRVEWDINRSWSVVAIREENGAFGVDFFFRKRLK